MDAILVLLVVLTVGVCVLTYNEFAREGKFLDSVITKIRSALRRTRL